MMPDEGHHVLTVGAPTGPRPSTATVEGENALLLI
jgi:hypothetical protein